MRVFVLCTGRCGSTSLYYACRHMSNFTVGHETRARFAGPSRLDYPDDHIEIDNRLSWFLGRLDREYGDEPYYVHLKRERQAVAESYARRMNSEFTLGAGHKLYMLMNGANDDLDVCLDVVDTVTANIELFLRDKSKVLRMSLENIAEDFVRFWYWIGAEGGKDAAIAEFRTLYNDGGQRLGALSAPQPKSELFQLRSQNKKLSGRLLHLQNEARRLERECAKLKRQPRRQRESRSWQLARPFRTVGRGLGYLRERWLLLTSQK